MPIKNFELIWRVSEKNLFKHRISVNVVKLVNQGEGRYGARNMIAYPAFHNLNISDEDLMAIEMNKKMGKGDKLVIYYQQSVSQSTSY